jgi:hypothetical protein
MPPSKGPVPQDAIEARRILIGGLAGGADILALVSQLAPQHPGNDTFPGEVFLRLGYRANELLGN